MRKILSCMLLGFVMTHALMGQINFGIKAGINSSSHSGDGTEEYLSKSGYHIGLTSDLKLWPLGIQPSILFMQKGFDAEASNYESECRLNYIEIPLNLYYGIGIGKNKIKIIAGPYYSRVIGGKYVTDFDIVGETEREIVITDNASINSLEDITDYPILPSEIGLNFGLGARIGPVQAEIIYSFGLTDINPMINGTEQEDVNKTTNLQISGTYFF